MSRSESLDATDLVVLTGGIALGATAALVLVPDWAPALAGSLGNGGKEAIWYLVRSSGLAAFGLLWLSVTLGLWISNRYARLWPGGPAAFALHEHASVLGLGLSLLHALLLLGDRRLGGTSLFAVLVPFASPSERVGSGLGQLALLLSALVTGSFYLRRKIGQRAWRALHFASFALFALAVAHGLAVGTDARSWTGRLPYAVALVSVSWLSLARFRAARA